MSPSTPQIASPSAPYYQQQSTFRKFTLDEYHTMIRTGVLLDGEPYELLEGHLVHKMSRGSPHDWAVQILNKRLVRMMSEDWDVRSQCAITLPTGSEPEPDVAVVRGRTNYRDHHPGPAEIGLLIEVSDSSLLIDRHDKARIYARENIPIYWVVSVVDKAIEVYTQPSGPGNNPAYARRDDYPIGSTVHVVLDGITVGSVAVADVMG